MRLWEMLTLADQTDITGRLLLEDSAPKAATDKAEREGIAMQTVTCPYEDTPSRTGGLMNASAYEALRQDTAGILSGFAWLTSSYLGLYEARQRKSTVRALYDVSHLGLTLPLFLFGRARRPIAPHGSLPSYMASIFKASRGVFSASVDMLNKVGPDAIITAADVVRFADENNHLIRPNTQRACAAPTGLIERTIEVLLTGERAEATKSKLPELIDFGRLWDFYSMEAEFSDALSGYGFVLNKLSGTGASGGPAELFGYRVETQDGIRTFGDLTESILQRANLTQTSLNRLLGRSERATPITLDELIGML